MTDQATVESVLMACASGAGPWLFDALDGVRGSGVRWQILTPAPEGDALKALEAALADHEADLREGRAVVLLCYPQADRHVAAALSDEIGPGEALDAWHDLARGVLGLRRHHAGVVLAGSDAMTRAPMSFLQEFCKRAGIAAPDMQVSAEDPADEDEIDPVARLIAQATVAASPAARDLSAELVARTLPTGPRGQGPEIDLDELWRSRGASLSGAAIEAARTENRGLTDELEVKRTENRSLIEKLAAAQGESREIAKKLEAAQEENALLVREIESFRAENRGQAQELAERAAELAELRQFERRYHQEAAKLELQTERLGDLQGRLDDQTQARTRAEEALAESRRQQEALTRDLDHERGEVARLRQHEADFLNSRSWRLTRPLRAVRNAFRRT